MDENPFRIGGDDEDEEYQKDLVFDSSLTSTTEIVQTMVRMIREMGEQAIGTPGGVREDVKIISGHIAVATLDDEGNPVLDVYTAAQVKQWYRSIISFLADRPGSRVDAALLETKPATWIEE